MTRERAVRLSDSSMGAVFLLYYLLSVAVFAPLSQPLMSPRCLLWPSDSETAPAEREVPRHPGAFIPSAPTETCGTSTLALRGSQGNQNAELSVRKIAEPRVDDCTDSTAVD